MSDGSTCPRCGADLRQRGVPCARCRDGSAAAEGFAGDSTRRVSETAGRAGHMAPRLVPMPEGLLILLEGIEGPARGLSFPLRQRVIVIGREEGELRIADPMVSRRHASIEVHDATTIILRDLSSTNGTLHNGQLIAFTRVQDGDEIRLGGSVLSLSIERS